MNGVLPANILNKIKYGKQTCLTTQINQKGSYFIGFGPDLLFQDISLDFIDIIQQAAVVKIFSDNNLKSGYAFANTT